MTTQERLDQVRATITRVLTGGRRFRAHDGTEVELPSIEELRQLERELAGELAGEQDQSAFFPISYRRPT